MPRQSFMNMPQSIIPKDRDIDVSGFAALIKAKRDKQIAEEQDQVSSQILQQGFQDPQGAAVEAFKTGDRGLAGLMLKQHQANIAAQQPKRANPTALMQNLAAAGLKPGSPEYRDAILNGTKRKGMVVNNVLPGSDKGAGEFNKLLAKQGAAFLDRASGAQEIYGKYKKFNEIAQDPNVRTGTLGSTELALKKLGNTVFGSEFDGLAEGEQLKKISGELLGDIRSMIGDTRMSDADRRSYMEIIPNINDSKESIMLGAEIMRKTSEGLANRANVYQQMVIDNGGYPNIKVRQAFDKYVRENPILSIEDIRAARKVGKTAKQPLPGAGMKKSYEKWLKD